MGYTHYFTQLADLTDEEFKKFSEGLSIIANNPDNMCILTKNEDSLVLDDLNNYGESMFISKVKAMPTNSGIPAGFNFCKTGHTQYDTVITASLILLHSIAGEKFDISSDGSYQEDWAEGQKHYEKTFSKVALAPF